MRFSVVAVVFTLLLTGCTTSPPVEVDYRIPTECATGEPSGNAPPIASLQGDLEDAARRIAEALGEDLPAWDAERSDALISSWRGDDLHVEFHHDRGSWSINRPEQWPTSSDQLQAFIDALDPPPLRVDHGREGATYHFVQTWQGRPLQATYSEALPGDGSGRMGWWSGLTFQALRDLGGAHITISAQDARVMAPGMIRCVLDAEGKTEDDGYSITGSESWGTDVHADSIVHEVAVVHTLPEPGHCGGSGRVAQIDGVTGALLGWEWVPCA